MSPEEVRAREVKLALRRAALACRAVRLRWYELRNRAKAEMAVTRPVPQSLLALIGQRTAELWAAEAELGDAATAWRDALARREALPVAARWNLVKMEQWASSQV